MKLETEGGISKNSVVKSDVVGVFDDDKGRGEFVILSTGEEIYIQAAGTGFGPYSVEYRDGDAYHHFQCSRELSKPEVQSAFVKYFEGDESWKTALEWKPLETQPKVKPWWKFW